MRRWQFGLNLRTRRLTLTLSGEHTLLSYELTSHMKSAFPFKHPALQNILIVDYIMTGSFWLWVSSLLTWHPDTDCKMNVQKKRNDLSYSLFLSYTSLMEELYPQRRQLLYVQLRTGQLPGVNNCVNRLWSGVLLKNNTVFNWLSSTFT